jgi:hypothetical protein
VKSPVFVSYRQSEAKPSVSDGNHIAIRDLMVQWALLEAYANSSTCGNL